MRTSARLLRRLATIGVGAAAAAALAVPPAHAEETTTIPIGPSANCVSSLGTDLICYNAYGTVTLVNHEDGTLSGTLDFHLTCTGTIGCTPVHVTNVPLGRSGVTLGDPEFGEVSVLTVPHNVLCLNDSCLPGFETPITAPTVSGAIATVWVAGTPISITVPPPLPGADDVLELAGEVVDEGEAVADLVIETAEEQARKHGVHIQINRPDLG